MVDDHIYEEKLWKSFQDGAKKNRGIVEEKEIFIKLIGDLINQFSHKQGDMLNLLCDIDDIAKKRGDENVCDCMDTKGIFYTSAHADNIIQQARKLMNRIVE